MTETTSRDHDMLSSLQMVLPGLAQAVGSTAWIKQGRIKGAIHSPVKLSDFTV